MALNRMQEGTYDTMKVCRSGHVITDSCVDFPAHCKPYCPICGEPTIKECSSCYKSIPGHLRGALSNEHDDPPSFCHECGMPFPWQISRVANAIDVLREQGVVEADLQEIYKLLPDITRPTPMTQSAALKLRRILSKAGKPAYDVSVRVIGDIAVASAKSYLGTK